MATATVPTLNLPLTSTLNLNAIRGIRPDTYDADEVGSSDSTEPAPLYTPEEMAAVAAGEQLPSPTHGGGDATPFSNGFEHLPPYSRPQSGVNDDAAAATGSIVTQTALAQATRSHGSSSSIGMPITGGTPTLPNVNNGNTQSVTYHTTNININTAPTTNNTANITNDHPGPSPLALPSPSAALQSYLAPLTPTTSGSILDNPLLSNFQSHAMSTVQNLASSFGHIAQVLQKDQAHTAREEENTRKKLTLLQNTINNLAAQNKDLANQLARVSDKSNAQARELNEKVNNINNKVIVGLSAVGVTITGSNIVGLSGSGTNYSATTSSHPPPLNKSDCVSIDPHGGGGLHATVGTPVLRPSEGGFTALVGADAAHVDSLVNSALLERLARLEEAVNAQTRRADISQANLAKYFNQLQEQMKKQQLATIRVVEYQARAAAEDSASASTKPSTPLKKSRSSTNESQPSHAKMMENIFDSIEAPTFEMDTVGITSEDDLTSSSTTTTGSVTTTSTLNNLPRELRALLSTIDSRLDESTARSQALYEMTLPQEKHSVFEVRMKHLADQLAQQKEQAKVALEKAQKEAKEAREQAARSHQRTSSSKSDSLGSAPSPTAASSASTAPTVSHSTFSPASNLTPVSFGVGLGSGQIQAIPVGSSGQLLPPRPSLATPPDVSFTPRSAMYAEQSRLDAAIASAAAAAKTRSTKDSFLSAEALAASAASHSAQMAAKQCQDILASINFMKENGQFSQPNSSGATAAANTNVMNDLFDDVPSSSDSRGVSSSIQGIQMRKLQEKSREQDRVLGALDSTVQSITNQLADLMKASRAEKEASHRSVAVLGDEFTNILQQFSALSRQFQAQHKVLDGRISNYREEFDMAIKHSIDALSQLEKNLDRKADMKLVLDKVSRSEYVTQIKKLKQTDEEILNRSVNREEYRVQLNEIREVMSEDQRERVNNITRIANELSKLVGDLDQKASKSELIDMANILNSMPKVHDEVENLKTYVNTEINARSAEILDVAVDRKQLKRSMTRLLKSLQEEVSAATLPVSCDACALRTGVHSGTNCLSCAQQMKLNAKLASYAGLTTASSTLPSIDSADYGHEIIASRGGGFMVTTANSSPSPSPPGTSYGRRPTSKQGLESNYRPGTGGSAIRPSTNSSSSTSRRPLCKTQLLPPTHSGGASTGATVDHFPIPGSMPSTPIAGAYGVDPRATSATLSQTSSVVGSDGRVYTSRGSRTHRLVSNSTKSRQRALDEGDSVGDWNAEESKQDGSDSVGGGYAMMKGTQSARLRK